MAISQRYTHLKHLGNIAVHVIDWNDLSAKLNEQLQLCFRWFPASRLYGIDSLDQYVKKGDKVTGFRNFYLNESLGSLGF